MSSFRIDRQYVAFQTAETSPVRPTPPPQPQPKADPFGYNSAYDGDINGLYNEIYEKLAREHAEQAELMLSKASEEAREIVENAKKQSEELLRQAKLEAESLRTEVTEQLESAARGQKCLQEQEIRALEDSLRTSYDTLVDGMQEEIVTLVMEIVRKIINVKLSQSDEVFLGLVQDALERLKQTGSISIRVGPEDYARYFGHDRGISELDVGEAKVAIVEEPDFSPGDLIVETEGEMIDLSIDRQVTLIENAFKN